MRPEHLARRGDDAHVFHPRKIDQFVCFADSRRHRLVEVDVLPCLERELALLVVDADRGGDSDRVHLALLEGGARVAFALRDHGRPAIDFVPEDRLAAANPGRDWVEEYLRELRDALQEEWHSYVYWRSKPYHGRYINIDEEGIRRTWNSSMSPSRNQLRIFMFGGSTMWGYGARDDFTIPSLVSKKLNSQSARAAWVVNLGETGYVSTQEVITLMLELRRGNVPDIAVFYDGVNDAWAAFQSGVAGIPQNEINRVVEFNLRDQLNWRGGFVEKLALYRLSRIARPFGDPLSRVSASGHFVSPSLANAVVDAYLGNVRLVNALAREFGFRAVFFWQPTIYSKNYLSDSEEGWRVPSSERIVRRVPIFADEHRIFNEAFRQKMKAGKFDNVYDLSRLFADDARTIFIDRFHVSEPGNDRIADAVVQALRGVAGGKAK